MPKIRALGTAPLSRLAAGRAGHGTLPLLGTPGDRADVGHRQRLDDGAVDAPRRGPRVLADDRPPLLILRAARLHERSRPPRLRQNRLDPMGRSRGEPERLGNAGEADAGDLELLTA